MRDRSAPISLYVFDTLQCTSLVFDLPNCWFDG